MTATSKEIDDVLSISAPDSTDSDPDGAPVAESRPQAKRDALRDVLASIQSHETPVSIEEVEQCFERLTPRERQVFACIIVEMTDKEMARHLGITPKTAEHYRRSVLTKMSATDARDLRRKVNSAC